MSYVICVTGQTSTWNFNCESLTFPFNVVAANSFASAVVSLVDRIECVVDHASGYINVSMIHYKTHKIPNQRTDFWNFSRYMCACDF